MDEKQVLQQSGITEIKKKCTIKNICKLYVAGQTLASLTFPQCFLLMLLDTIKL